jgi:hypothetical protein
MSHKACRWKEKFSLCLIKHQHRETCWEVEVYLYAFLTSAQDGVESLVSLLWPLIPRKVPHYPMDMRLGGPREKYLASAWNRTLTPQLSNSETSRCIVRFEVFTSVTMKNAVFWDVAPCIFCVNRRFGGTYLWFLARGFFYPEDEGDTFLRNVCSHKIYTAPHPRRLHSS